jgi:uncharacterized protein YodC (DUF2158 family)
LTFKVECEIMNHLVLTEQKMKDEPIVAPKFKKGDVVTLNSGGIQMTVCRVDELVRVEFSEASEKGYGYVLKASAFDPVCLTLVSSVK